VQWHSPALSGSTTASYVIRPQWHLPFTFIIASVQASTSRRRHRQARRGRRHDIDPLVLGRVNPQSHSDAPPKRLPVTVSETEEDGIVAPPSLQAHPDAHAPPLERDQPSPDRVDQDDRRVPPDDDVEAGATPGAPGVVDEHLQSVRVQAEGAAEATAARAVAHQACPHAYAGNIRLAGEAVEMREILYQLVGVYAQVLGDEAPQSRLKGRG